MRPPDDPSVARVDIRALVRSFGEWPGAYIGRGDDWAAIRAFLDGLDVGTGGIALPISREEGGLRDWMHDRYGWTRSTHFSAYALVAVAPRFADSRMPHSELTPEECKAALQEICRLIDEFLSERPHVFRIEPETPGK